MMNYRSELVLFRIGLSVLASVAPHRYLIINHRVKDFTGPCDCIKDFAGLNITLV